MLWQSRALLALLCSLSLILVIGQYTDLDLVLADLHFDARQQLFPWDKTWFARDLMHGHVKKVIVWTGFLLMSAALFDLAFPLRMLDIPRRAGLRVLALSSALEPMLIRTLKDSSNLHCPWGVDRYNGSHPFLRLLDAVPDGWAAGHCFPAGHASTAMWLSAFAVFWLPHNPRRATQVFLAGLGAGLILGWVQQMRGQHFLTHTLWTAWLSSALIIGLIALFSRWLCAAPQPDSGTRKVEPQRLSFEEH